MGHLSHQKVYISVVKPELADKDIGGISDLSPLKGRNRFDRVRIITLVLPAPDFYYVDVFPLLENKIQLTYIVHFEVPDYKSVISCEHIFENCLFPVKT